MFNVVAGRLRRRVWTPRTVAASVGAHLLLLFVFVIAAEGAPGGPPEVVGGEVVFPPDPPPPMPVTPPPPASGSGTVVRGDPDLQPPEDVPDSILPPNPHDGPVSTPTGQGPVAYVPGLPTPGRPSPPRDGIEVEPVPCAGDLCTSEEVTVLPHLANEREAQRMLQRVYPPLLRDAGITGRTTVVLIIDRNGNVEPRSVRVQESSDPRFDEAAVRAVEKFRFTPAEFRGRAVSVEIALPIDWQVTK